MSRTRFIEHRGQRIVLLDFSGLGANPAEALRHIAEAREFIGRLPPDGSARTLTDALGARYNSEILQAMKELAAHNKPYVDRAAVVTDSGLHRIGILAVATFSGRSLRGFADRDSALDWLAEG